MNKLKHPVNVILIIFVLAIPEAYARFINKTEDTSNFTKSPSNVTKTALSYDSYECSSYTWDCDICVAKIQCKYCSLTDLCVPLSAGEIICPNEYVHYVSCPVDRTIVYVVAIVGTIALVCKALIFYCIFRRKRRLTTGTVITLHNPTASTAGRTVQTFEINQETPKLTGASLLLKNTNSPPPYEKF